VTIDAKSSDAAARLRIARENEERAPLMLLAAVIVFAWISASLFFLAVCAAAKRGGGRF
jgi:hypothetical protein